MRNQPYLALTLEASGDCSNLKSWPRYFLSSSVNTIVKCRAKKIVKITHTHAMENVLTSRLLTAK